MSNIKGLPNHVSGGIRSVWKVKAKLKQCIEIQILIRDRTYKGSPTFTNAQRTLDILTKCLESNEKDAAEWDELISLHRRSYGKEQS